MPALLDLLPAPGRATLGVACGEGRLTRHLRSLGHRVTGIDASPTMVPDLFRFRCCLIPVKPRRQQPG